MTAGIPISSAWASLVTGGFASGGIPYIDQNNLPAVDIANLFWDATNKRLSVAVAGDITGTDAINTYGQHDSFQWNSQIPGATPWLSQLPGSFSSSSARGNANALAASQTGDYLGGFFSWAALPILNPTYTPVAGTWGVVRGTGTAGDGNLGGELHFGTKTDAGIFTDWGYIDAAGIFRPTLSEGMGLGKTGFQFSSLFLGYAASGGVGAQIINKTTGRSSIALGQTSVVITNSKVLANSIVLAQLETVDATMKSLTVTPGVGSFTVTGNAACAAQVAFSFVVIAN